MNWFFVEHGVCKGPLDHNRLRGLAEQGVLTAETLVWYQGMPGWQTYAHVCQDRETDLPPPACAAPIPAGAHHACSFCDRMFHENELIRFDKARCCAACKPEFAALLREACTVPAQTEPASFLLRVLAYIIDVILLGTLGLFGGACYVVSNTYQISSDTLALRGLYFGVILLLVHASYEILMVGAFGATLGKLLLGLKIVNGNGSALSYPQALRRYVARNITEFTFMGYFTPLMDRENRAQHDFMCDTRVVKF